MRAVLAVISIRPLTFNPFYHAARKSGVSRAATSGCTWIREYRGNNLLYHDFNPQPILLLSFFFGVFVRGTHIVRR